jgi:L-amino acid N-acyltransferase YncA/DNA-binding transcriptional ArsR family regulator
MSIDRLTGMTVLAPNAQLLPIASAADYAECFACLADPTRVRLLHAVATSAGGVTVGELTGLLGISQSTCSHHVRRLADVGFVHVERIGTSSRVTVNEACCTGLPHMADVVMGSLAQRPCCPDGIPADVTVRGLRGDDWADIRRIHQDGIDTGIATFETEAPPAADLIERWLPAHRWVAEVGGKTVGFTAISPVSDREYYRGVGETSVYVEQAHRGRGIGKALLHRQVTAADHDGLWTLQTSIFTENRAGLALHHQAGYRTVGIRERIAQRAGVWHDMVLLERRRPD